jgi:hypothetical protein
MDMVSLPLSTISITKEKKGSTVEAAEGLKMHMKQETGITVNLSSRLHLGRDVIFPWKRRYVRKWELCHP